MGTARLWTVSRSILGPCIGGELSTHSDGEGEYPIPLWTYRCLWKHYLPATTFADGKNIGPLAVLVIFQKYHYVSKEWNFVFKNEIHLSLNISRAFTSQEKEYSSRCSETFSSFRDKWEV